MAQLVQPADGLQLTEHLFDELACALTDRIPSVPRRAPMAPSIGGPIARDRLWFFTTYSFRRGSLFPAGFFKSEDTSALIYVPDLDEPTFERTDMNEGTLRLTWQATSKDKVQAYWGNNTRSLIPNLSGSQLDPLFIAPEAGSESVFPAAAYQVSWIRPQTNRILFEAGVSVQRVAVDNVALDAATQLARGNENRFDARPDLYGTFEATTLTISRNQGFFSGGTVAHWSQRNTTFRASMSYVTGSHNLKVGIMQAQKWMNNSYRSDNNWTNQITFNRNPVVARFVARPNRTDELTNAGVYAQDQWTIRRFTVNAGLRFDYFKGFYPRPSHRADDVGAGPPVVPGDGRGELEGPAAAAGCGLRPDG